MREFVTYKIAGCKNAENAGVLFKEMYDRGHGTIEIESPKHGGRETRRFRLNSSDLHPATEGT